MTAYRYVRLGQLPAEKQGGTWRVRRADLDAFRNADATSAPADDAGAAAAGSGDAGTAGERRGRRRAPWAERLESRLVAGDARGSWGVVESALASGADLDEIYLDVLAPAMASIGERWQRGELEIHVEHRATGIAMRLIGRLGPRFSRRGRTRGVVVVGAPAGERHSLPVAMLGDLMRLRGYEVFDLGADVPGTSWVQAVIGTTDTVAVGVSVSSEENLAAAAQAFGLLRSAVSGVLLVVGGLAVRDAAHAAELGADAWAASADEFVALIEQHQRAVSDRDGMVG